MEEGVFPAPEVVDEIQEKRLWRQSQYSGGLRRVGLYKRHLCDSLPYWARDSERISALRNMGCHDTSPFHTYRLERREEIGLVHGKANPLQYSSLESFIDRRA